MKKWKRKNERNIYFCSCLFSLIIRCGNIQLFIDCTPRTVCLAIHAKTRNGRGHYFYPQIAMLITVLGEVLPIWMSVTHYWYLNFACCFGEAEHPSKVGRSPSFFLLCPLVQLTCLFMLPSLSFNPSDNYLEGFK